MTLIELILVMGLIAMVLGAGLGAFATIDPGRKAAVGIVQNIVRTAHNTSVARRAPARVRLDPATGEIVAEAMTVLGTWHFESVELEGGDGLDGVAVGTDDLVTDRGYLGAALDFSKAPRGGHVEVPIQDDPAFDPRMGFAFEFAVRPLRAGTARLVALGDVVEVELEAGGALAASFRRRARDEVGRTTVGGRVSARTPAGAVPVERWSRISVTYDRRALRVLVDGVPLAATFSSDEVAPLDGPLRIGGGSGTFPGLFDELVLAIVTGDQRGVLPQSVRFAKDAPRAIEFAAGGALDPTRHTEPVTIELVFDDGGRETVRVGLYGTVE